MMDAAETLEARNGAPGEMARDVPVARPPVAVKRTRAFRIVPFVLILALVIILVVTSQATAPFIYTLF